MNALAAASSTEVPMVKGLPELDSAKFKALVSKMDHDLHHQLHKHEVPEHVMAVLVDAGFTSGKLFRFFGETAAEVKENAITMGLKPKDDFKAAGIITKMQLV